MKTIISSAGNTRGSHFDLRFGRAAWFCLLDETSGKVSFHRNENLDLAEGTGKSAVEQIANLGANRVISGDFGPKVKALLDALNIQMVIITDDSLTIKDIILKIK
jgi:predicted Fe-Mo cluster-binding NifX family protein